MPRYDLTEKGSVKKTFNPDAAGWKSYYEGVEAITGFRATLYDTEESLRNALTGLKGDGAKFKAVFDNADFQKELKSLRGK